MNIAEKNLADGLLSHIKEKLEGYDFFTVTQVHQRALAVESQIKSLKKVISIIVLICILLVQFKLFGQQI